MTTKRNTTMKIRSIVLLLLLLLGSLTETTWAQTDAMVVPASEIDLTGSTGYWIRNTAGKQIVASLARQLTWTHVIALIPIEDDLKRDCKRQ